MRGGTLAHIKQSHTLLLATLKRRLYQWYPELEEVKGNRETVQESIEKATTTRLGAEILGELGRGRGCPSEFTRAWHTKNICIIP